MTTEAEVTPAAPKRGVGTVIREALIAGQTNEQALAVVKAEFPSSATTAATVSWYRNNLRKAGNPQKVPSAAEAKKAQGEPAGDPLDS